MASTADWVGLGESLVVGDGPGGGRHHSLSDGVGAVEEKILGEEESVSVEQDSHVVARIIMQIIFKPSTRIKQAAVESNACPADTSVLIFLVHKYESGLGFFKRQRADGHQPSGREEEGSLLGSGQRERDSRARY